MCPTDYSKKLKSQESEIKKLKDENREMDQCVDKAKADLEKTDTERRELLSRVRDLNSLLYKCNFLLLLVIKQNKNKGHL